MYFAQVIYKHGGSWHTGETPEAALFGARRHVAMTTRELRAAPHYVLEFPDGTEITVNDISGAWSSSASPIRVERFANLLPGTTEADLLGQARR